MGMDEGNIQWLFVEHLPVAGFIADSAGKLLLVNRAFARCIGSSDNRDFAGVNVCEVLGDRAARFLAAAFAGGTVFARESSTEIQLSDADGNPRWLELTWSQVCDRGIPGSATVGVLRDITATKAAEAALQKSEERYRTVFENAPVGIFHTTAEGKLVAANPAFARSIGYETPEALISAVNKTDISSLYGNPSRRASISSQTLAADGWNQYHGPFRRRDGSLGIGNMMLRSYRSVGSGERRLEGFMEDVSVQEESRRTLEYERTLLRSLMDNVPERISFKDLNGCYILINRAQALAIGLSDPKDAVGRPFREFYSEQYAQKVEEAELRVRTFGEMIVDHEEREISRDGIESWVTATRMALRDETGSVIGTIGVSHDIGAQKHLETQLIRAHRMESLAQLAAGIAHQFNNINMAIAGYLTLIETDSPGSDALRRYTRSAFAAVRKATRITRSLDILSSAKRVSQEIFDLGDAVRPQVETLQRSQEFARVAFNVDVSQSGAVLCDRETIAFVLSATISNALDAVIDQESPSIRVCTRRLGQTACLEVSDNGIGIPEDDLKKIFTPFFTTKGEWAEAGSAQSRARGIGLGLTVSRSIVYAHGGSMEIQSKPGDGTTVRVHFPVVDRMAR